MLTQKLGDTGFQSENQADDADVFDRLIGLFEALRQPRNHLRDQRNRDCRDDRRERLGDAPHAIPTSRPSWTVTSSTGAANRMAPPMRLMAATRA